MRIWNKKAGFQFFFLVVAILAGALSFFIARAIGAQLEFGYVGENGFRVLGVAQKGFSAVDYITLSGGNSIDQAIYEITSNGGYVTSNCGRFNGANSFVEITEEGVVDCYLSEEEIVNNFAFYFDRDLNKYLGLYPDAYLSGDYEYSVEELDQGFKLVGQAESDVVIPIGADNSVACSIKGEPITSPMQFSAGGNVDVLTIEKCNIEVLEKYSELCTSVLNEEPPLGCLKNPVGCCITSGYRHPTYNAEVGGSKNSQHQYGLALDVYVGEVDIGEKVKWAKEAQRVGFTGIGIYPGSTHMHIDLREEPSYFVWVNGEAKSYNSLEEIENKYG